MVSASLGCCRAPRSECPLRRAPGHPLLSSTPRMEEVSPVARLASPRGPMLPCHGLRALCGLDPVLHRWVRGSQECTNQQQDGPCIWTTFPRVRNGPLGESWGRVAPPPPEELKSPGFSLLHLGSQAAAGALSSGGGCSHQGFRSRTNDAWKQGRAEVLLPDVAPRPPAAEATGPVAASGVHPDDHGVLSHDLSCLPAGLWFLPFSPASLDPVRAHICSRRSSPGLLWAAENPDGHRRGGREEMRCGQIPLWHLGESKAIFNRVPTVPSSLDRLHHAPLLMLVSLAHTPALTLLTLYWLNLCLLYLLVGVWRAFHSSSLRVLVFPSLNKALEGRLGGSVC